MDFWGQRSNIGWSRLLMKTSSLDAAQQIESKMYWVCLLKPYGWGATALFKDGPVPLGWLAFGYLFGLQAISKWTENDIFEIAKVRRFQICYFQFSRRYLAVLKLLSRPSLITWLLFTFFWTVSFLQADWKEHIWNCDSETISNMQLPVLLEIPLTSFSFKLVHWMQLIQASRNCTGPISQN